MKRAQAICVLLLLLQGTGLSQRRANLTIDRTILLSRLERLQLQRDIIHLRAAQRNAERDGRITPYERRKLKKIRQKAHRNSRRYRRH